MPDLSGSFPEQHSLSRRSVLKGIAGAAALSAVPGAVLAACSSSGNKGGTSPSGTGGAAGGSISFGSNYSDPAPKGAFASLVNAAESQTGVNITVNTVDHNTFQDNISNYLQGTPNDLATWFAGYRLQYFAAQQLLTPIDDVWEKIGGNFNDAAKNLSKGIDGKYYLVPIYNYPWVVFAEKDGWPALGTFDILNLRINGYDYHIKLMKHEVEWTDKGVTDVFQQWRELMPYLQNGANGRIWQDAAKTLENKQAGMMFQGSNQVAANYSDANLADLVFFPYPVINT